MIGPQPPKPGEEISPEEAIKRNIEARAKKMEDKLLGKEIFNTCNILSFSCTRLALSRGHTLITLAHKGTYLVCKMLTTVL